MAFDPFPPTWKRLPDAGEDRLLYQDGPCRIAGPIMAVIGVSGISGTLREMIRLWPDDRMLFVGGVLFSIMLVAVGLSLLIERRVSINKSKLQIRHTWRWFFLNGEKTQDLAPYDSVGIVADRSDRPEARDRFWRMQVCLTGAGGASLVIFERQSLDDAQKLTQEVATLLGLEQTAK